MGVQWVVFRDQSVQPVFEVDVDGLGEISWWILGYGDQAEVLEPAKLREMIASHAEGMLAKYDDSTN